MWGDTACLHSLSFSFSCDSRKWMEPWNSGESRKGIKKKKYEKKVKAKQVISFHFNLYFEQIKKI